MLVVELPTVDKNTENTLLIGDWVRLKSDTKNIYQIVAHSPFSGRLEIDSPNDFCGHYNESCLTKLSDSELENLKYILLQRKDANNRTSYSWVVCSENFKPLNNSNIKEKIIQEIRLKSNIREWGNTLKINRMAPRSTTKEKITKVIPVSADW